jgi:hypothetical protein
MEEEILLKSFKKSSYSDLEKYKKHIEKKGQRWKDNLNYIQQLKKPCLFCQSENDIEFHHIDPNKKDGCVKDFKTYSKKRIDEEIKKCWCLCNSCHKKLHKRLCDPLPSCYDECSF